MIFLSFLNIFLLGLLYLCPNFFSDPCHHFLSFAFPISLPQPTKSTNFLNCYPFYTPFPLSLDDYLYPTQLQLSMFPTQVPLTLITLLSSILESLGQWFSNYFQLNKTLYIESQYTGKSGIAVIEVRSGNLPPLSSQHPHPTQGLCLIPRLCFTPTSKSCGLCIQIITHPVITTIIATPSRHSLLLACASSLVSLLSLLSHCYLFSTHQPKKSPQSIKQITSLTCLPHSVDFITTGTNSKILTMPKGTYMI